MRMILLLAALFVITAGADAFDKPVKLVDAKTDRVLDTDNLWVDPLCVTYDTIRKNYYVGYRSAYGEYPSQEWNIDSFYVEQVVSINQLGEQAYLPDLWVQMTSGLCIHEDTLFVLDGGSSRLIEYDLSGDSIIAALSIDDYKYDNLYGCCTDSMGHVYIADYDSSRVYCVNTSSQTFSVMQLSGPDYKVFP